MVKLWQEEPSIRSQLDKERNEEQLDMIRMAITLRRRQFLSFATVAIWTLAAACALGSFIYGLIALASDRTYETTMTMLVTAVAFSLAPWLLAYGLTRVLYGIEAAMNDKGSL